MACFLHDRVSGISCGMDPFVQRTPPGRPLGDRMGRVCVSQCAHIAERRAGQLRIKPTICSRLDHLYEMRVSRPSEPVLISPDGPIIVQRPDLASAGELTKASLAVPAFPSPRRDQAPHKRPCLWGCRLYLANSSNCVIRTSRSLNTARISSRPPIASIYSARVLTQMSDRCSIFETSP
jgi:hypothetical protein